MFKKDDRVFDIILDKVGTVYQAFIIHPNLPIQVRWDDGSMPCTYTENGRFDVRDKAARLYHLGDGCWQISIPPKEREKVKAYKWVVKLGGEYVVAPNYYREGQIEKIYSYPVYRIDESMIEVPE